MKTALQVNTDLTTEVLSLDESDDGYAQISGAVGGMVQAVRLTDDLVLWCNEESKLLGMRPNIMGTHLWEMSYGQTDVIAGNIVLTGVPDGEGYSLPLPTAWLDNIQESTGRLRAALEERFGGV